MTNPPSISPAEAQEYERRKAELLSLYGWNDWSYTILCSALMEATADRTIGLLPEEPGANAKCQECDQYPRYSFKDKVERLRSAGIEAGVRLPESFLPALQGAPAVAKMRNIYAHQFDKRDLPAVEIFYDEDMSNKLRRDLVEAIVGPGAPEIRLNNRQVVAMVGEVTSMFMIATTTLQGALPKKTD